MYMVHCAAQDPNVHLKNLKPSPPASAIVDRCIECGFCESNCPSRDITLTPRQRITTWREISRLQTIENRSSAEQQRCAGCASAPSVALLLGESNLTRLFESLMPLSLQHYMVMQ